MYRRWIKRTLDVLLALAGILICLIPMLGIGLVTKLDSPGPVLFRQKRIGLHKRPFTIYKFRTMSTSAPHDVPTHRLKDAKALMTKWQRFLRESSLDELPQLFCILAGKMSVIGPRPALWNQDDLIMERDRYGANDVKPGLTGWAQINGRDELSIPEKARLDGEYAQQLSFLFDARCFFGSIPSVLRHQGVKEGCSREPERRKASSQEQHR